MTDFRGPGEDIGFFNSSQACIIDKHEWQNELGWRWIKGQLNLQMTFFMVHILIGWKEKDEQDNQREIKSRADTAGIIFLLKIIKELFFSMNILPVETLHFVCVLNSRIHSTMMRISWAT